MTVGIIFIAAYILDLLVGDPRYLPHPVIGIARLANFFEKHSRKIFTLKPFIAGVFTVILTLLLTSCITYSLLIVSFKLSYIAGLLASTILLYFSLATKSLLHHSKNVYDALFPKADIDLARKRVAMIVGRETSQMSEQKIVKAAVESVAENLVDGITAPMIWAFLLSIVAPTEQTAVIAAAMGAIGYKAVNTMDSIFGYRNDEYIQFGRAAAKLDDVVNFIPARISVILILLAGLITGKDAVNGLRIAKRDRLKHLSPNAGHPEAAVAGVLHLQFGGPAKYHGLLVDKPYIGDKQREFEPDVILETNRLIGATSLITIVLLVVISMVGGQ